MKHIIIADSRPEFLQNISTYILIEEKPLTVAAVMSLEQALQLSSQQTQNGATLVISENVLMESESAFRGASLGQQIFGYCTTAEGRYRFSQLGIPCIGLIRDAKQLVDIFDAGNVQAMEPVGMPREQTNIESSPPVTVQEQYSQLPGALPEKPENEGFDFNPIGGRPQDKIPVQQPAAGNPQAWGTANKREPWVGVNAPEMNKRTISTGVSALETYKQERPRARVITVYAAKGGVGKTTIATETAVCLALTNNGHRRLRVCLVDYNIDFGDVLTTLNLEHKGPNMTHWCNDIRLRISMGEQLENIQYTKEDMEHRWLHHMPKNGLYVLTAPIVHEDSMDIGEDELSVMLRNLVENGEFDYVVCDTGNNTRDSAVIALEAANYVLLIATQDVTTANCNDAFLSTVVKIGFDISKILLVINNIMPAQSTGISVKEIEENFPHYPCAARIKRDEAVIKANNYGEPLVYNPKHDFSKQIQQIVRYITDSNTPRPYEEVKRAGFFFRLFGKR